MNQILVDESVDHGITVTPRDYGFNVLSITEKYSGLNDSEVLKLAVSDNSLLITEDRDFGEPVFKHRQTHSGVLYIRINKSEYPNKLALVKSLVELHIDDLRNNFSVLKGNKLRLKGGKPDVFLS